MNNKTIRDFFKSLPKEKYNNKYISEYETNHLEYIEEFVNTYDKDRILSKFDDIVIECCNVNDGSTPWFGAYTQDWATEISKDLLGYFYALQDYLKIIPRQDLLDLIKKDMLLPIMINAYNYDLLSSNKSLIQDYTKWKYNIKIKKENKNA